MLDNQRKLLQATAIKWWADKCPQMGAALSFYSLFSMGPLLVIVLAITGAAFGAEAASGNLFEQIEGLVGEHGATGIQAIVAAAANEKHEGIIATILSVIMLVIGSSGVFAQLQDSLNVIWRIDLNDKPMVTTFIKNRFLSFAMVVVIGFLLLTSLVISTALSALNDYAFNLPPLFSAVMQCINILVSFGVITVLFAVMFKVLPDMRVSWRHVWPGAALTAALFSIGKYAIGLYLGQSSIASSYGAAGSLVVILIWIYYSAQILLFGAEFTYVYANRKD